MVKLLIRNSRRDMTNILIMIYLFGTLINYNLCIVVESLSWWVGSESEGGKGRGGEVERGGVVWEYFLDLG